MKLSDHWSFSNLM